jgi:hypothetical protein
MGSENADGCAQNAENGFGLDFLERYHKDGDEFLSHIIRVTGDEIWVSFVNVEIKEQPKQWRHIHSPEEPKKFKQTSSARKLVATVFWYMKGVLMVEFIQGTTLKSQVYCERVTKVCTAIQKKCVES